jgi:hypothetical protein
MQTVMLLLLSNSQDGEMVDTAMQTLMIRSRKEHMQKVSKSLVLRPLLAYCTNPR